MELAVAKERSDNTKLAARSRFGKFTPEKEQPVRKTDVKEDEVIRQLKSLWNSYELEFEGADIEEHDLHNYSRALELVRGMNCSAKHVEKFSVILSEFSDEYEFRDRAGFFLSALMEDGKDSTYVIHTKHFDEIINNIGFKNRKNIVIKGNVGYGIGDHMTGGSITVEGDASAVGAEMTGGIITVEGNTGEKYGFHFIIAREMNGGKIIIKGDVGALYESLADWHDHQRRKQGEIHLEGNDDDAHIIKHLAKQTAVRIYHKGELIVGK